MLKASTSSIRVDLATLPRMDGENFWLKLRDPSASQDSAFVINRLGDNSMYPPTDNVKRRLKAHPLSLTKKGYSP